MTLPEHSRYVVIGAGVHGLSTAWHLARELEARGAGDGRDIVLLDKTGVGAGPSGIACGVIRNNYFQPAMRELMAHSVQVWESDVDAFHYHPIGYLQIAPEVMRADVAQIYEEQKAIGYPSELIEGEDDCRTYMESIFSDWQAKNITAVLHEKKGGYAENMASMRGLRGKSEALGVELHAPVTVTGFADRGRGGDRRRDRPGERSPASRSWWRPAPGSATSGTCSTCPASSTCKGETARCTNGRCGPTGASRRGPSASTPPTSSTTTGTCRRSCTSTRTRR